MKDIFDTFSRKADELLGITEVDSRLVAATEELIPALEEAIRDSEALRRYREVKSRLPRAAEQDFIAPPNFPYTLRSS